jgi:hypothetical protein
MGSVETIIRGHVTIVNETPAAVASWTTAERLQAQDLVEWLSEKREGAGRDHRLSALKLDVTAPRPLFKEAVVEMDSTGAVRSLFRGPSATREVCTALVASGHEPIGYDAQWPAASGVSPKSGIRLEHGLLITLLWILSTIDRLDLYHIAGFEHICRRLLQIQRAVRRNARAPDFDGLESYMSHALDPSGGVLAPDFDRHVASIQKDEAMILKQGRLAREEVEHAVDRGEGKPPRGKKENGKPEAAAKAKAKKEDG